MTRTYLDANVFVYAAGAPSPRRESCRQVLRAVASQRIGGETSAYTVQELVRQRRRRGDDAATSRGRDVLSICSRVHPVDHSIAGEALDTVDRHPRLDISDAIHVATALRHGIAVVLSADADLDGIDGIDRVDPLDRARVAALLGG